MKPLLQLFFLFFSISSWAVPFISPEVVQEVLNRDYAGQSLYWKPSQLPLTVELEARSAVANQLAGLFAQGLIQRERSFASKDLGKGRKKIVLQWRYHWPDPEQEGIIYGVRRLHSLLASSEPIQQDGVWYVEARVRWWVDRMPSWTGQGALKKARLMRRSRESKEKPFETTKILVLKDNRWRLWQPETDG